MNENSTQAPTTRAEEMLAAAKRIREYAKNTTPVDGDPAGWLGTVNANTGAAFIYGGPTENGYRTGTVFEFKDEMDCEECARPSMADLNWMWLMCPLVAEPLATWLEREGLWALDHGDDARDLEALHTARAINGTSR